MGVSKFSSSGEGARSGRIVMPWLMVDLLLDILVAYNVSTLRRSHSSGSFWFPEAQSPQTRPLHITKMAFVVDSPHEQHTGAANI